MAMGIFTLLENVLLYHPHREVALTPAAYGIAYENVEFEAEDGVRLHGWYIAPNDPRGQVLLWAHGNAGNVSHRTENIALIKDRLGAGVFIFDYRGYGKSAGRPSEEGLYADGRAAHAWLLKRIPPERVFLYGRSLGAAVAVKLAAEGKGARGLILESPFESTVAMGKKMLPFLPVGWIVSQKFDNAAMIPTIHIPLLILHGDADEIVPHHQGKRLYKAARMNDKRFFTIQGAGHNDTYLVGGTAYWAAWQDFLEQGSSLPK